MLALMGRGDCMSGIIDTLHRDHGNLSKLLSLLEAQVDAVGREANPDVALLADIADYMTSYPDQVHHPAEDRIYAHFVGKHPEFAETLVDLREEHRRLSALTQNFDTLVKSLSVGQLVTRADFAATAREYIHFSRRHIELEERDILPVIAGALTARDWRSLESELTRQVRDPLLSTSSLDPYSGLYHRITGQAR